MRRMVVLMLSLWLQDAGGFSEPGGESGFNSCHNCVPFKERLEVERRQKEKQERLETERRETEAKKGRPTRSTHVERAHGFD
jgi:hypothetical protein